MPSIAAMVALSIEANCTLECEAVGAERAKEENAASSNAGVAIRTSGCRAAAEVDVAEREGTVAMSDSAVVSAASTSVVQLHVIATSASSERHTN